MLCLNWCCTCAKICSENDDWSIILGRWKKCRLWIVRRLTANTDRSISCCDDCPSGCNIIWHFLLLLRCWLFSPSTGCILVWSSRESRHWFYLSFIYRNTHIKIPSLAPPGRSLSPSRLGPLPERGSLRVLCSILAVPRTALFWTEISDVVPGICSSHSPSLGVTALRALITTGTTVAFTPHIFFSSSCSPWYFSSFLCSFFLMLLSLGIATSITTAFFRCLSTTTMSSWLATTILSVWIWNSHRIFAQSFSTIFGGVFHLDLRTSSPYSTQMLRYTLPAIWLWRSIYALSASTLHPTVMCCNVRLCTACTRGPVWFGRPQPLWILWLGPVLVQL